MDKQLLCTFTQKNYIISTVQSIIDTYVVLYDKIYIYENNDDKQQFLCAYNISRMNRDNAYLPNTISTHRKKQSNTMYTINALNELIKESNNGILDKEFIIDWNNYQDYIIIISDGQLRKIKIIFRELFFVNKSNQK